MNSVDELNELFSLEDWLSFEMHASGLILGRVVTPDCRAEFMLHGAHLLSYQPEPRSRSILFVSDQAIFEPGKPIRGGVPICFPWFGANEGDAALPAHGWARTQEWEVLETARTDSLVIVRLGLAHEGFVITCEMTFGAELSLDLNVLNPGDESRSFEVALHTYFQVKAIDGVEITGLEGVPFWDQLKNQTETGSSDVIRFTEETDRIYQGTVPKITLVEKSPDRSNEVSKIEITPRGSRSTIVWNPWVAKSKRMADFGDDEYLQMCCIETANVRDHRIKLNPGQSHTTGVSIRSLQQP